LDEFDHEMARRGKFRGVGATAFVILGDDMPAFHESQFGQLFEVMVHGDVVMAKDAQGILPIAGVGPVLVKAAENVQPGAFDPKDARPAQGAKEFRRW
jgi:hypothetical protein